MRRIMVGSRRDERGAVGLMVAILFAGGVFLGCVALTVDYGHLNANHSQLQSSADAAASRAAWECATADSCPDMASLNPIAQANDNIPTSPSPENRSSVTAMCGNGPGLSGCDDSLNNNGTITTCPEFSEDRSYVQVLTQKDTRFLFAGNGQGGDETGQACAAAAWGKVGSYTAVLPVTFSACEWQFATGGDPLADPPTGTYAPSPPYPPSPPAELERTIMLAKDATPCESFNGHDAPGGFGWVANNNCQTPVSTYAWIQVDTGNDVPPGCDLTPLRNHVVKIPVFDCMYSSDLGAPVEGEPDGGNLPPDPTTMCSTGNGTHLYYHVAGFAAFYLTGWHLSGSDKASSITGQQYCSGSQRCLYGFFVEDVEDDGDISTDPTDPDFGVKAIQMIG